MFQEIISHCIGERQIYVQCLVSNVIQFMLEQLLKSNEAAVDGSLSYDYSTKLWSDNTASDSETYRWTATTWSPCNATCGTGNFHSFICLFSK